MRYVLWGVAVALCVAGIVMYLIWQTSWAYWVGGALVVPLALIIFSRTTDQTESRFGDPGSGPWTGP